jgi:zinc/manganese transport system permease protein
MFTVIDWLQSPFQYEFMRHAFLAGSLAAILTALVGFFVVVRQLGFAAHALGHIGFAGAAGAILMGWLPIIGQLVITMGAAIVMGSLGKKVNEKDTIIGVTLAFALGLGILFLHLYKGYSGQAASILFGDLLGVSATSIQWMTWLSLFGLVVLAILSRPLWFSSLTPMLAEARKLPIALLSILFFAVLAFAITLASQVVGVLLVFALVVGPPAIALQWVKSFWSGILLCLVLSLIIVWVSIYSSYYTDIPVSFWICSLVFVFYLISLIRQRFSYA